jgi:cytochrome c peroxidase
MTSNTLARTALTIAAAAALTITAFADNGGKNDNKKSIPAHFARNESGVSLTLSSNGQIDRTNPFFLSLGTNGRACVHCHQPDAGWSITPSQIKQVFEQSGGMDPLFRLNDGSNSPKADVSTVANRRAAYSMLLNKGNIRVGLPVPANAEFELAAVDDPYGFASAAELSLFRRPLPGTNVRFVSAVMWDGRETMTAIQQPADLISNLLHQSNSATLGHAEAAVALKATQQQQIVNFVLGLHTAQVHDDAAGALTARGAKGGPKDLPTQDFFIGINDPIGMNPKGTTFDPEAIQLFGKWRNLNGPSNDPDDFGDTKSRNAARQAVARGEQIFNTRSIALTGVGGLNDALGAPMIQGTCTTCHDTPNVGNHSVAMALNIGIADESLRTPDMPLYTLRHKQSGAIVKTTDPGRALITGKWADVGKFKGPTLRTLAGRAPYFHNGMAATLADVVDFYNTRFTLNLSAQEKSDLIAFLRSL